MPPLASLRRYWSSVAKSVSEGLCAIGAKEIVDRVPTKITQLPTPTWKGPPLPTPAAHDLSTTPIIYSPSQVLQSTYNNTDGWTDGQLIAFWLFVLTLCCLLYAFIEDYRYKKSKVVQLSEQVEELTEQYGQESRDAHKLYSTLQVVHGKLLEIGKIVTKHKQVLLDERQAAGKQKIRNKELRKKNEELQQEVKKAAEESKGYEAQQECDSIALGELREELETLKDKLSLAEGDRDQLKNKNSMLKQGSALQAEQIGSLEDQLKQTSERLTSTQVDLMKHNDDLIDLQKSKARVDGELKQAEAAHTNTAKEFQEHKASTEASQNAASSRIEKLKEQLQASQHDAKRTEKEREDITAQLESQKEQVTKLEKEKIEIGSTLSRMQAELAQEQKRVADLERYKQGQERDLKDLRSQLNEKCADLQKCQAEKDNALLDLTTVKGRRDQISKEYETYRSEADQIKLAHKADMLAADEYIVKLKDEQSNLEKRHNFKIRDKQNTIDQLNDYKKQLKGESDLLKVQRDSNRRLHEDVEKLLTDANSKKKILFDENFQLESRVKELEAVIGGLKEWETRSEEAHAKALDRLRAEVEDTSKELLKCRGELTAMTSAMNARNTMISTFKPLTPVNTEPTPNEFEEVDPSQSTLKLTVDSSPTYSYTNGNQLNDELQAAQEENVELHDQQPQIRFPGENPDIGTAEGPSNGQPATKKKNNRRKERSKGKCKNSTNAQ